MYYYTKIVQKIYIIFHLKLYTKTLENCYSYSKVHQTLRWCKLMSHKQFCATYFNACAIEYIYICIKPLLFTSNSIKYAFQSLHEYTPKKVKSHEISNEMKPASWKQFYISPLINLYFKRS